MKGTLKFIYRQIVYLNYALNYNCRNLSTLKIYLNAVVLS